MSARHHIPNRRASALAHTEEARQIAENVTGLFSILAEWSRAEIPTPANDAGKPAASDDKEARHDR